MTFRYASFPQQIVFGAGELTRLGGYFEALQLRRALLCTSRSYVRNGAAARVHEALGERLVRMFSDVRPHVLDSTVVAALDMAQRAGVDTVIGLGGGSALGTAKAVVAALARVDRSTFNVQRSTVDVPSADDPDTVTGTSESQAPVAEAAQAVASQSTRRGQENRPGATVVAIPTTYAGSEMTPIYGVTAEGRKRTNTDPQVVPRLVLYDPELTLDLPCELTATTGINALAHCIEGLYSRGRTPVTDATALTGAGIIYRALPLCVADGRDLRARTDMLAGAYLGGTTIANARLALHHGICHVLGGAANVPHGLANAIVLPHVLRFNLPAATAELASLAAAIDIDTRAQTPEGAAESAVDAIDRLIASFALPRRLRDVGVVETDLARLASIALTSPTVHANPRPVTDGAEIEDILRSAW